MHRLGLDGIAKRLLDEKRQTEDVTPPPHIAPCGMEIPSKPGARLAAATKGAKRAVDPSRKSRATDMSQKPSAPQSKPKRQPAPFEKFFKKR